jgi:ligand-binding sensor domain-containing protein
MDRYFKIFLFLFFSGSLLSQAPSYRLYTIADGLPHTETTKVFLDKKGYLWIGCSNGWVSKFDGIEFQNFSPEELGIHHHSYHFWDDGERIWAWDTKNEITFFQQNKWHPLKTPSGILSIQRIPDFGFVVLTEKGKLFQLKIPELKWEFLSQINLGGIENPESLKLYQTDNLSGIRIYRQGEKEDDYSLWELNDLEKGTLSLLSKKVRYVFLNEDFNYTFNPKGYIELNQSNGISKKVLNSSVYFEKLSSDENGFLVQTILPPYNGRGIYYFDEKGCSDLLFQLDIPVTNVIMDHQGHFWFASQTGLGKVNPWVLNFFDDQPGMIPNLHSIGQDSLGNIWFGGYRDGFAYYDGSQINPYEIDGSPLRVLPGSFTDESGTMYFWTEGNGLVSIGKEGLKKISIVENSSSLLLRGYFFRPLKNGNVALGLNKLGLGIAKLPLEEIDNYRIVGKEKGLMLDNVICIAEDSKGRIWTGRPSQGIGLYFPDRDTAITWLMEDYPNPGIGAMSLEVDSTGTLWIGTNKGLYFLENSQALQDAGSFFSSIKKLELAGSGNATISALKAYKNWLFFSSSKGHGFLDLNSLKKGNKRPLIIFENTVAPAKGGSGEQNAILIDNKNRLWIGKDRGAVCIDLAKMPPYDSNKKMLDPTIIAGGTPIYPFGNKVTLPLNKRNLKLILKSEFNGISNSNVNYKYRIGGEGIRDTSFFDVGKDSKISFDYLSPGDYRIYLNMYHHNQLVDSRNLEVIVPGTLSEKPFFWVAVISLMVLFIGSVFYLKRRAELLRKNADLEKSKWSGKLQKAQISALTSSLNPHFINNALNWLQYKVMDDSEAVAVVGRLSENIRTVFQHSRAGHPDHSLSEEIRIVENYLLIQGVRYNQKMDVQLPDLSDKPHLEKVRVPIMQLLIHVENAIEHGIRNRKNANTLKISVQEEEEFILLSVEDDGIGRTETLKKPTHGTRQGHENAGRITPNTKREKQVKN